MKDDTEIDVIDTVPTDPDFAMLALLVLRETRWTHEQLAERLGCCQQTVSRALDGRGLRSFGTGARLLNLASTLVSEREFARHAGEPASIEIERIEASAQAQPIAADALGLLLTLRRRGYSTSEVARSIDMPVTTLGRFGAGAQHKLPLDRGLRLLDFARRVLPAELYRRHVTTAEEAGR